MRQTVNTDDALRQNAVESKMPATGLACWRSCHRADLVRAARPPLSSHQTGDGFHKTWLERLQWELSTTKWQS